MLYPDDFELKIGFSRIRELLYDACLSELGRQEVEKMAFSFNYQEIIQQQHQTEEFRQILLSVDQFPSQDYYDTLPLLTHLHIENTYPEPDQLAEFRLALTTYLDVVHFFNEERAETYPNLSNLLDQSQKQRAPSTEHRAPSTEHPASRIADLINRVLDAKSQIRSGASKELKRIRQEINRLEGSVQRKMNQLFNQAKQSGWTADDTEVTIRDGRLVIPFRSAHKRKIQGVVHDESATGQTVYVEPVELFEMNNEIRELFYAEKREIIRILRELANEIRPHIDDLIAANGLLGQIDFIRAKASFALKIGAMLCNRMEEKPHLQWEQAIHPLLFLSHQKAKKNVVPLYIKLAGNERILVISGPNAGGKSICLKTVGLLQYMFQCGLLPSAREGSEFGIFRQIMIDIGDEQSLENDLSTYTSKLLNMKYFMEHMNDHSLFLIDEMGTGTDPSIGGAIAEAALLKIASSGAYGVVTTHYTNLKLLATSEIRDPGSGIRDLAPSTEHQASSTEHRVPSTEHREPSNGIINGAMLFDTKEMKPLYQLKIGKPGSSFAIEIATSIGFPEEELRKASETIGGSQLNFDRQLQDLELEKVDVKQRSTELGVADDFLNEIIDKYQKLTDELEKSKKEILSQANEEAQQILKDSNKLIERTIKEIRESQADKERTKKARAAISDARCQMPDSRYQIPDTGYRIPDKANCEKRIANSEKRTAKSNYSNIIINKQASFTSTLDLRGKRADEAFLEIQRFIDDAILVSAKEIRILHGKGTGALREVTRNYLQTVKEVKKYHDEVIERGGAGITVVNLE